MPAATSISYEDAQDVKVGDTITFRRGDEIVSDTVCDPIHVFGLRRGLVVFVPVPGELVVHRRIVSVERG